MIPDTLIIYGATVLVLVVLFALLIGTLADLDPDTLLVGLVLALILAVPIALFFDDITSAAQDAVRIAAVAALAVLVIGGLAAGAVAAFILWRRRTSSSSQAGRAMRSGRLGEALRRYAIAGQLDQVIAGIRDALPDWPVRAALIQAATDLLELRRGAAVARSSGVSPTITAAIVTEADRALDALWPVSDRLAAVAAQGVRSESLDARLADETARLERVIIAARRAREGLAEATLGRGGTPDLELAEVGLRLLGDAARDLG